MSKQNNISVICWTRSSSQQILIMTSVYFRGYVSASVRLWQLKSWTATFLVMFMKQCCWWECARAPVCVKICLSCLVKRLPLIWHRACLGRVRLNAESAQPWSSISSKLAHPPISPWFTLEKLNIHFIPTRGRLSGPNQFIFGQNALKASRLGVQPVLNRFPVSGKGLKVYFVNRIHGEGCMKSMPCIYLLLTHSIFTQHILMKCCIPLDANI